jgi:hypothetical protein
MKVKLSAVVLIFSGVTLFAQENETKQYPYNGKPVNLLASVRLENASFHIYEPPFKAKAIYEKMEEAKCLTPEELVESIESETNQTWVVQNNMPGKANVVSEKAFEYRKKLDKNTNYFELIHKLTFSYNGMPTAIIKYYFVDDGKRTILASMVVQEKDGRWFRTSIAGLDHLEEVFRRVKPETLALLFSTQTPEDASDFFKKIRKEVKSEQNILDSEKLFGIILQLSKKEKLDDFLMLCDKSNP